MTNIDWNNKEEVSAYNRRWRENNVEQRRQTNKDWYAKNKEAQAAKQAVWRAQHRADWLIYQARDRAKNNGLNCDLEPGDIVIPDVCPILRIRLECNTGGNAGKTNSPSLDRIDNAKGYTKDNVQVISRLANTMKASATPEQLLKFADWVYKTYGSQNL